MSATQGKYQCCLILPWTKEKSLERESMFYHCLYVCSERKSLKEVVQFPRKFQLKHFIYTGIFEVMRTDST